MFLKQISKRALIRLHRDSGQRLHLHPCAIIVKRNMMNSLLTLKTSTKKRHRPHLTGKVLCLKVLCLCLMSKGAGSMMLAHAWEECRAALKVITCSERRPGRKIKQDTKDEGPLDGENAVLYRSAREGLDDRMTFK